MKKYVFATTVFLCLFSGFLSAQISRKYSNEFLAIGAGGKSFGMANSCVATTDDVTSGYWNPAGLLGIKSDMQFGVMHSEYFAGLAKYDYGAIAKKIKSPNASRAVGTAIGHNPVAFLIPCHRVIQSTGTLGGYMWGPTRKAAIIGWEAAKTLNNLTVNNS